MRRLLRDIAEHRDIGDTTTLADANVMTLIGQGLDKNPGTDD
jgi:acetyl-CoA synthetase